MAWIRTALTFATFGFGMVGFFRAMELATHSEQAVRLHQSAIHMGVALIVIGMVATILAACSHWMILRRLRRGEELMVVFTGVAFLLTASKMGPDYTRPETPNADFWRVTASTAESIANLHRTDLGND